MVEFVDELPRGTDIEGNMPVIEEDLPPVEDEPRPPPKGGNYRINPGKGFRCACRSCTIVRKGDRYDVKGPAYHHRDSASEALVCKGCGDRFIIHPTVNYTDANMKGLV